LLSFYLRNLNIYSAFDKRDQFLFFLQNIVKNLERQEVRDWLSSTKDLLMEEKKVNMILTVSLKGRWKRETMGSGRSQML
jgi:hypothetical protein